MVLWDKVSLAINEIHNNNINTQKLLQQCHSMVIMYFEWLLLGIDREKSGCLLCSAFIALSGVSKITIITFSPHFAIRPLLNSFAPSSRSAYDTRYGIHHHHYQGPHKVAAMYYYKPWAPLYNIIMKYWKVEHNIIIPTVTPTLTHFNSFLLVRTPFTWKSYNFHYIKWYSTYKVNNRIS